MKNVILLSVLLFAASQAIADDTKEGSLTLAAADFQGKAVWVDTQEDVEKKINDDLTEKSQVLLDKVTAQLTQKLEAETQDKLAF